MAKNLNNISFNSNGKLLLTGEYVVLDGALSLAIPTKYGQSLDIESIRESKLIWKSLDEKGRVWFEDAFEIINNEISHSVRNDNTISGRLLQILNATKELNPDFLNSNGGFKITTKLDFPRHWGLGTSSTLINNMAQWAKVDAYQLLENTFRGSGYDIACAQHNTPITYQILNSLNAISLAISNDKKRNVVDVDFNPSFKENLYFVYLNQKQNSRDGIAQYKNNTSDLSGSISEINKITKNIITCNRLDDFISLIEKHESIISKIIKQDPVKERLFNDFNGGLKSLGAWGGDFILVVSNDNPENYFKTRGYQTLIPYRDMIL
ncbi:GYDIA family GHMP kinase [Gelatiniphilus marinus]|uniref:GYDIA family GHMP kinase n=1 Tax=Gelatiniphilus marinus TaxID=1759464 RepID=A0ABW5JPJ1_9FLAO